MPHYFVERPFGHKKLFRYVAHPVERCPDKGEQVPFDLVRLAHGAEVGGAGKMVTAEEDAHATDADTDADDLSPVIANTEESEGEQYDNNDGPEINELRGHDGRIPVCKYGEVITLHV